MRIVFFFIAGGDNHLRLIVNLRREPKYLTGISQTGSVRCTLKEIEEVSSAIRDNKSRIRSWLIHIDEKTKNRIPTFPSNKFNDFSKLFLFFPNFKKYISEYLLFSLQRLVSTSFCKPLFLDCFFKFVNIRYKVLNTNN